MSNTAPVSYPIQMVSDENGVIVIRVFFQDPDLSDSHSLVLNADEMKGSGTVVSDDTFHYDPGTAFDYLAPGETATDTFTYTITDSAGESTSSTVTVTVTGQNDGPVAAELAKQTDENTAITIAPEFTDPDTSDSHSFTVDTTGTIGSVTVNADGTFSYDPNGQFDYLAPGETASDTFTYTVTDAAGESSTETVTVTVTGVSTNTPPITYPVDLAADEDGKIIFRVIFEDPDAGDSHTHSVNTDGLKGVLTETSSGIYEYAAAPDFDYLAEGETGTTTFTYTVTDSFGASHTSTVTLTITGQNDGPVASAMNVSTTESSPVVITPDFTDPDASDTHTFTIDTSSTTGTVTINDDGTFTYNPNGKFDALNRGETATDTFTYTVTDSKGESSTETVTVTVQGESDVTVHPGKLVASDGAASDYFGHSIQANSHGVVVVGSYQDDDKGDNSGSVYVYTPDGSGYTETKLVASDGSEKLNFGFQTAINVSGVIAVKSRSGSGTIHVFTPTEGGGYSETELTASVEAGDRLALQGLSINADGVIAALGSNSATKSTLIYIFTPDGSGGYTQARLHTNRSDGAQHNVTINDNGVVFADGPGDLAYVYMPDGSGGYTELQLKAPDSNVYFGRHGAVAEDGTIVVNGAGAVYVHKPDGNGNYKVSKLVTGSNNIEQALATNEAGVIVVGERYYDKLGSPSNTYEGAAYVYVPDGAGGYKEFRLTAPDASAGDFFGNSVSINDDGVITVGSIGDDDKGSSSGSVYVFTPDENGNYVGYDGTVYEPIGTPVIETFETTPLTFNGSDASEVLKGGDGADVIAGNGGDDKISGGAGDDVLTGGEGNDTFVFKAGEAGHDVIKDFAAGEGASDVIEFESSVFADFDAVVAAAEQVGANTVITLDDDTSITLQGVTLSSLHQDDFAFLG